MIDNFQKNYFHGICQPTTSLKKEYAKVAFQGVFQNFHGSNSAERLEIAISVLNSRL